MATPAAIAPPSREIRARVPHRLAELWKRWSTPAHHPGQPNPSGRSSPLPASWTDRLPSDVQTINQVISRIETRFLQFGDLLEHQSTSSSRLVRESDLLLQLASGSAEGQTPLQAAVEEVQNSIHFIQTATERTRELGTLAAQCLKQLTIVSRCFTDLQGALTPLTVMQTLFKIQAAHLSPEVQMVFNTLTHDISTLHKTAITTSEEQAATIQGTRESLRALARRLERQHGLHSHTTRKKREQVEQSIATLTATLQQNQTRDYHLDQASRELNNQIGHAVVALQYQDITRQKLEHVRTALEAMHARSEVTSPSPNPNPAPATDPQGESATFLLTSSRVQARQVEAAAAEIQSARSKILDAIQAVQTQIQRVSNECAAMEEFQNLASDPNGLVQTLLNSLDDTQELLTQTIDTAANCYEVVRPFGGMASNLTNSVRRTASDIRLIALNAQIQATHSGTGTGLEILSARTRSVSEEAGTAAQQAATELQTFIQQLDALVHESEGLNQAGKEHQHRRETLGPQLKAGLLEFRQQSLQAIQSVADLVRNLNNDSASALNDAEADDLGVPLLSDIVQHLDQTSQLIPEWLTRHGLPTTEMPATGNPSNGYTMESERLIHARALQTQPVPEPSAAPPSPAPQAHTATDVDFFFDQAPDPAADTPPAQNPTPGKPPTQMTENVELF